MQHVAMLFSVRFACRVVFLPFLVFLCNIFVVRGIGFLIYTLSLSTFSIHFLVFWTSFFSSSFFFEFSLSSFLHPQTQLTINKKKNFVLIFDFKYRDLIADRDPRTILRNDGKFFRRALVEYAVSGPPFLGVPYWEVYLLMFVYLLFVS